MTTHHIRTLPRLPSALVLLFGLALSSACGDATSVGAVDYVVAYDDPSDPDLRSIGSGESWIGRWLAPAGDVDGNGTVDLVAQGTTQLGLGGATSYSLLYLGPGGQILATTPLEILAYGPGLPWVWDGSILTEVGDLNGDGINEIAVHGRSAGGASHFEGLIVYFLNTSGEIASTGFVDFGLIDGFTAPSHNMIRSAAPAGDINGDGVPDLAVTTAPLIPEDLAGSRAWVAFMTSEGHVAEWHAINARIPNRLLLDVATAGVPQGITGIGDVDGDGVPDLAVGDSSLVPCTHVNPEAWWGRTGDIAVVLMNSDGSVKCVRRLFPMLQEDRPAGLFDTRIGDNLRDLGDLDGDGIHELLVQAYLGRDEYLKQGFWIVYLGLGGRAKRTERVNPDLFGGEAALSSWTQYIGSAALGDISGNGEAWFAVVNETSRYADAPEGALSGRLWLAKLADRSGQLPPMPSTDDLGECVEPEPDEYQLAPLSGAVNVSFAVTTGYTLTTLRFAFSYALRLGTFSRSDGLVECTAQQTEDGGYALFGVLGRQRDVDGSTCERFQYEPGKPEQFVVDFLFETPTARPFLPLTCKFLVRGESADIDADAFTLDYVEAHHNDTPIPGVVVSISDVAGVP